MNTDLYSPSYGHIRLLSGWPPQSNGYRLPLANTYWIVRDFGNITLQEVKTEQYLFRYFIFYFLQQTELVVKERGEGLQSILSLKGQLRHGIKGRQHHIINEGQFTLLDAGESEMETVIPAGAECHLFNTYYAQSNYIDLLPVFPTLKNDLTKAIKKPRFFLFRGRYDIRH